MKKAILCVLLTLSMSVSAFALEVPTDTVVQNLNGSQQVIKTFTIPADQDPQSLIEQPFELEGYLYTFTDIVKTENAVFRIPEHNSVGVKIIFLAVDHRLTLADSSVLT